MDFSGMFPGLLGQGHDGVFVDADEARGLSDAVLLGEMGEDRQGFFVGEPDA